MSTNNGTKTKIQKLNDEERQELERLRAENERLRKSRVSGGRQTWRGHGVSYLIRVLSLKGYTQGEINKGLGMAGCWIQSGNTLSTQYQKAQNIMAGKIKEGDDDYVETPNLDEESFEILKTFIEGPDNPKEMFGD